MTQPPDQRESLLAPPRRALLVGIERVRGQSCRSLGELERLVAAAGMIPAGVLVQTRPRPHPDTFLGKGKLRQVRARLAAEGLDVAVVNAELSSRQVAAMGEALDCTVMDRTEVILEIFAQHARTREGALQVELARLEYLLPRLVGRGADLSQIAGGRLAGGAIGVRGPGEPALELDRRVLRHRMNLIKRRLDEVVQHREVERSERERAGLPLVGLVGYTNGGKSSLLNALAGEEVVAAHDRLFETLDTTIRRVDLGERTEALISDTVGFLDDLPTGLISAFRATLEETVHAALLVEVLDASDPLLGVQHDTVENVLGELGVLDKPRLIVLNKWDLVNEEGARVLRQFPEGIPISALTGAGLDNLRAALREALSSGLVPLTLHLPYNRLQLLQFPPGLGRLLDSDYRPEHVVARVRVHSRLVQRLRPYVVAVP